MLLLLVGIVVVLVVVLKMITPKIMKGSKPASRGNWLFGHTIAFGFQADRLDWVTENLMKNDWKPVGLQVPGQRSLSLIADEESIEAVLKSKFNDFEKGEFFNFAFDELLGDGIFNSDGDVWRKQRKMASFVFTSRALKEIMLPVFVEDSERICHELLNMDANKEVDIQKICADFTMNTFCKIAFGIDRSNDDVKLEDFITAFDDAQVAITKRFFNPPPLMKLLKAFKIGSEGELGPQLEIMESFLYDIIDKRFADYEPAEKADKKKKRREYRDLIGLYLDNCAESGTEMSREYLRNLILNFLVAGRDTTAEALTWTFYELSQHPELEETLRSELNKIGFADILESKEDDDKLNRVYEAIQGCDYLNGLFREIIRLHPSVPVDSKVSRKNQTLPNGLEATKGAIIMWSPYALGRRESLWGKDCKEIRPERWYEGEPLTAFQFPAFNAGKRNCMGKTMALLEGRVLLATLLSHLHPTLPVGQNITYHPMSITLWMKDPMMMKFSKCE